MRRALLITLTLLACEEPPERATPVEAPEASACESATAAAQLALDTFCGGCHAQANEGGMDFVLDAAKLAERGKLTPGDPAGSRLLTRIEAGEMPPPYGDPAPARPDDASVAAIETWIACGAPAFDALVSRPFLSPAQLLVLVDEDLQRFDEDDRLFQRYLSLAPLYNAGRPEAELAQARDAVAKLVNSLSWASHLTRPHDVHEALLRIDLRDYEWSSVDRMPLGLQAQDVWELLVERDPYGTTEGPLLDALIEQTGTTTPILRADWFVAVAAVPPAYHEILQLPTTDESLEWRLGVAVAGNLNGREPDAMRAGFRDSGVSNNNRLIERHPSPIGPGYAYWKSYDFAPVGFDDEGQRRNLFDHPLGPGPDPRDFKHDGGEIIFSLPNGLQAYLLVDAAGDRIDVGPIDIVRDNRRPNASVINGLSCMSCHAHGMIEKADEIRAHVGDAAPGGFSAAERAAVEALYPPADDLRRALSADRERFLDRLADLDVDTGGDEPISAFTESFEGELDLARAAAELGLTRQAFADALAVNPTLQRTFGSLGSVGVERAVFQRNFRVLACELRPSTCGVLPLPTRRPQRPSTACPGVAEADGRCNGCPANVDVPDGFVCLPGGRFAMGSPADEPGHNPGEARRPITISRPLLMMARPVTRARARDFGLFTECGRDCPIESIDWYEAVALANALSADEGLAACYLRPNGDVYEAASARLFEAPIWRQDCDGYRLPTEAEWEFAARAQTTSAVYTGDITVLGESDAPELDGIAWYAGNSGVAYDGYTVECAFWPEVQRRAERCGVQPAGLKTPNRWGLYDMIGNVSEWCWDWYAPVPAEGPQIDPEGPELGSKKVVRGGGWFHVATSNRAAARGYHDPTEGADWLGVRFVRAAPIVGAR